MSIGQTPGRVKLTLPPRTPERTERERVAGSRAGHDPAPLTGAVRAGSARHDQASTLVAARLAVPVADGVDAEADAEAAQRHVARARVVGDVVRSARSERQQHEAVGAGAEGVRDPGPRRARDDAAGAHRVLVIAEQQRSVAVEHHEQLLLGGMAVRRRRQLARRDREVREADQHRAERAAEVAARAADVGAVGGAGTAVGECDDRRWPPRLGRRQLERSRGGLGGERIRAVGGQPARRQPPGAGARQPRHPGVRAAAEHQHVEPGAGAGDRVRLGARAVQDAVPRADRVGAPVLPAQAVAGEHVEQLLLVTVDVDRHRVLAGTEPVTG